MIFNALLSLSHIWISILWTVHAGIRATIFQLHFGDKKAVLDMKFIFVASKLFSGKIDYAVQEGFVLCVFFLCKEDLVSRGMIFIRDLCKNCAGMAITQLHHFLNSLCYVNDVKMLLKFRGQRRRTTRRDLTWSLLSLPFSHILLHYENS